MGENFPDKIDTLFVNCNIATMANASFSNIIDAAIVVTAGKISWVGKATKLPVKINSARTIDCEGKWILPGFIDCHTHLVWGGSRSNEFEMRLNGATYEEISKKGGGIFSTVQATRNATEDELYVSASKRISTLLSQGVTTVEIKSGYGLDLETELKMLSVINRLNQTFPITIHPTFLGAHALPPEFKSNPDKYIDLVVNTMLPQVKKQGIATAVDVFCENIAFNLEQTEKVFKAAKNFGFNIKLHAEQLSDSSGTTLAAQYGALSCDHLEYLSESGVDQMAKQDVTAVLLPGAFYFLKETKKPPVTLLRNHRIPMAISTDLNPGSSPIHSLNLILNMACLLFDMTCEEAILGVTINGAKALGVEDTKGSIEVGKDADLVLWDIDSPSDLCYLTGLTPIKSVMVNGITQSTTPQQASGY